ncbi:ladderlectin-like isoform X2 [Archocentrus centrarchus]|uniref:ladderlectin-like isoform X2 n=1 Tax=Archocentrus centrarchus TaxID=63155 RepID=UPI0011EA3344|nr:ladderlectin-like isoform X2 [Archocentrus centrarchus]
MRVFFLLCAAVALHITTANPVLHLKQEPLSVQQNNTEWLSSQHLCPPGFRGLWGRCFTFFPDPMAWIDAEKHCWLLGANLASIHDLKEYEFLIELMKEVGYFGPAWIGASDAVRFGDWLWSDGSPYEPWVPNLPESWFRWRHCLAIHSDDFLRIDRHNCEEGLPFLCGTRPGC